jgi:hypothetical protein
MVTTNQALLKIRNQVVPNNIAKHRRKAIQAETLETYLWTERQIQMDRRIQLQRHWLEIIQNAGHPQADPRTIDKENLGLYTNGSWLKNDAHK